MKIEKAFLYNLLSLVCGLWFLLTGWIWTYFANLFIAYPVGLLGLFFWHKGRKANPESLSHKFTLAVLIAGLIGSIGGLFFYK